MKFSYRALAITLSALLCMNSIAFGQLDNPKNIVNISPTCRGEVLENILESVNICTEADLNRAYQEITILEASLIDGRKQIEEKRKEVAYRGTKFMTIMVSSLFLGIVSSGIGTAIGITKLQTGFTKTPKQVRYVAFGAALTLLMSTAGMYYGKTERTRFEIAYGEELTILKYLHTLMIQIKLRKTMIAAMIELKLDSKK